jgi:hypothetical protein
VVPAPAVQVKNTSKAALFLGSGRLSRLEVVAEHISGRKPEIGRFLYISIRTELPNYYGIVSHNALLQTHTAPN